MLYLQKTQDDSFTLRNSDLEENYHSNQGARSESEYVFIRQGLNQFIGSKDPINLLEVGFGTGLNALLTCLWVRQQKVTVNYTTLEPYPIPSEIVNQLSQQDPFLKTHQILFQKLHKIPFETRTELEKGFHLLKTKTGILRYFTPTPIDLVYFDAFSPNKAQSLWQPEVFKSLYRQMAPGGVIVTYCAKGQLKRDLKAIGFLVETLPGALGKREMVRARKSLLPKI